MLKISSFKLRNKKKNYIIIGKNETLVFFFFSWQGSLIWNHGMWHQCLPTWHKAKNAAKRCDDLTKAIHKFGYTAYKNKLPISLNLTQSFLEASGN